MELFEPVLPHGQLKELFPDVFFVSGMMKTMLMGAPWQFSRNMTVVRHGNALNLINSIRLDDDGLAQLEALGRVTNVIKIGSMHGRDDPFYKARYGAKFWSPAGMVHTHGLIADHELAPEGEIPFEGCGVFAFRTSKMLECILRIDRAGGILVSSDSLQNWVAPDEYFSEESRQVMTGMGFFQPANIGPLWMQLSQTQASDFDRLRDLSFRHALCGHGAPLLDIAKEAYLERFRHMFATK